MLRLRYTVKGKIPLWNFILHCIMWCQLQLSSVRWSCSVAQFIHLRAVLFWPRLEDTTWELTIKFTKCPMELGMQYMHRCLVPGLTDHIVHVVHTLLQTVQSACVSFHSRYFSDLSLWDIHRTQAPLLTLLRPDISSGITHSLLSMYEQGGALPRWPIANGKQFFRIVSTYIRSCELQGPFWGSVHTYEDST